VISSFCCLPESTGTPGQVCLGREADSQVPEQLVGTLLGQELGERGHPHRGEAREGKGVSFFPPKLRVISDSLIVPVPWSSPYVIALMLPA